MINDVTPHLGTYPQTDEAVAAIAAAHGVPSESVLPTAGGAEAFTLLARALRPNRPVVVHPQFTEPEAALIAAGHGPERVILTSDNRFRLDPDQIPADADLVMVGNPTNPTSVLHPAATLRALLRPGRTLVVDEAFHGRRARRAGHHDQPRHVRAGGGPFADQDLGPGRATGRLRDRRPRR